MSDDELIHSIRRKVQLGALIKTRCGVEVTRTSMENRQLFKSTNGERRMRCVWPGAVRAPTCRRCCQLLGLPITIGGATFVRPRDRSGWSAERRGGRPRKDRALEQANGGGEDHGT